MPTKKNRPDTDLTPDDLDEIEKTLPKKMRDAQTQFLKLSQQGKRPTWIRIWRRRGLTNALDTVLHILEAPYRRGEPALVEHVPESVKLGGEEAACWRIRYGDKINKAYPEEVMLPIMEYVWDMLPSEKVGKSYVIRRDKGKDVEVAQ